MRWLVAQRGGSARPPRDRRYSVADSTVIAPGKLELKAVTDRWRFRVQVFGRVGSTFEVVKDYGTEGPMMYLLRTKPDTYVPLWPHRSFGQPSSGQAVVAPTPIHGLTRWRLSELPQALWYHEDRWVHEDLIYSYRPPNGLGGLQLFLGSPGGLSPTQSANMRATRSCT